MTKEKFAKKLYYPFIKEIIKLFSSENCITTKNKFGGVFHGQNLIKWNCILTLKKLKAHVWPVLKMCHYLELFLLGTSINFISMTLILEKKTSLK